MKNSIHKVENAGNRILAIIPARSGSKGIENKNLAQVGGHTLLEWSISAAKSTDLEFIRHSISELKKLGRKPNLIVHLRPTSPLREPEILDEAIIKYLEIGNNFTSLRSIHKMS